MMKGWALYLRGRPENRRPLCFAYIDSRKTKHFPDNCNKCHLECNYAAAYFFMLKEYPEMMKLPLKTVEENPNTPCMDFFQKSKRSHCWTGSGWANSCEKGQSHDPQDLRYYLELYYEKGMNMFPRHLALEVWSESEFGKASSSEQMEPAMKRERDDGGLNASEKRRRML